MWQKVLASVLTTFLTWLAKTLLDLWVQHENQAAVNAGMKKAADAEKLSNSPDLKSRLEGNRKREEVYSDLGK